MQSDLTGTAQPCGDAGPCKRSSRTDGAGPGSNNYAGACLQQHATRRLAWAERHRRKELREGMEREAMCSDQEIIGTLPSSRLMWPPAGNNQHGSYQLPPASDSNRRSSWASGLVDRVPRRVLCGCRSLDHLLPRSDTVPISRHRTGAACMADLLVHRIPGASRGWR